MGCRAVLPPSDGFAASVDAIPLVPSPAGVDPAKRGSRFCFALGVVLVLPPALGVKFVGPPTPFFVGEMNFVTSAPAAVMALPAACRPFIEFSVVSLTSFSVASCVACTARCVALTRLAAKLSKPAMPLGDLPASAPSLAPLLPMSVNARIGFLHRK